MSIVMRGGPVTVYRCDGWAVYGSYGEASGEAGDSCSTLVYETTVTLLEANPSRLRTVRRGEESG